MPTARLLAFRTALLEVAEFEIVPPWATRLLTPGFVYAKTDSEWIEVKRLVALELATREHVERTPARATSNVSPPK
jgi:hypothetical protein